MSKKHIYIVVPSNLGGWDHAGAIVPQSESFFKGGFQAACKVAAEATEWHSQFDQGYSALVCRLRRGVGWQVICQF